MTTSKKLTAAFYATWVLIALTLWIGASHLEANAYERVTGKHVSTWDAMFLELRVQEPSSPARGDE